MLGLLAHNKIMLGRAVSMAEHLSRVVKAVGTEVLGIHSVA